MVLGEARAEGPRRHGRQVNGTDEPEDLGWGEALNESWIEVIAH
jgi:hypothetical protein